MICRWNPFDTGIDPFFVYFTGADKDATECKGIVDFLLSGTADTSQADLNHGFNPGHL
jgi:hypothetical protein